MATIPDFKNEKGLWAKSGRIGFGPTLKTKSHKEKTWQLLARSGPFTAPQTLGHTRHQPAASSQRPI